MTSTPSALDAAGGAATNQAFVARLPILDANRATLAYELAFRPLQPDSRSASPDFATARVVGDAVLGVGLDALTNGHKAMVPVSRRLLLEGVPEVLPPDRAVLLLAADIEADTEILNACRHFKREGFELAIDDFVLNAWTRDLVPLATYLKVNFPALDREARAAIVAGRGARGPKIIAAGVDRMETFEQARDERFDLFQGYFFGKPVLQSARTMPAQQVGNLRLLQALNKPDISVSDLEDLIKHDVTLTYRVLRTVNSAAFAQRRTIESIRQALMLLGRDTIRRWASLWALSSLGGGLESELVVMSTVRARACELLGTSSPEESAQGFFVGMCSLLDAMLGVPMTEAIAELPLATDVREALLGEPNAHRLRLEVVTACETGDWADAIETAAGIGVNPDALRSAHSDALRWAHDLHQLGSTA